MAIHMQGQNPARQPEFLIVVPLYNAGQWIAKCLVSIAEQQSPWSWRCVVIDDASDDGSPEIVQSFIDQFRESDSLGSFAFVRNQERVGALTNIVNGFVFLEASRNPLDVLMIVDGDDWLYGPHVFSAIASTYQERHCWMTWGGLVSWPVGLYDAPRQFDDDVVNGSSYRRSSWQTSHLRTFQSHLWYSIKDADLRGQDNLYYSVTWDMALMFPMLEMAGPRAMPVDQLLYSYNCSNPISDHIVRREMQYAAELEIRAKDIYPRKLVPDLSLRGAVPSADRLKFLLMADQNPAQALFLSQVLSLVYPGCATALLVDPGRALLGDFSHLKDAPTVIEHSFMRGRIDFVEALHAAIRQLGMPMADGEWLFLLDADSYPLFACHQLLERLDSSSCDAYIQYEQIIPGQFDRPWQETCYHRYFGDSGAEVFGKDTASCFAGSPWMILGSKSIAVLREHQLARCSLFSHYSALQKDRDDRQLGDIIPEESYFQCLLVNQSALSIHCGSAIFSDWSPGRPRELIAEDLDGLRQEGWLFAQSFGVFSNQLALAAAESFILRESLLR